MAIPGFQDLDFHAFHRVELPARIAGARGAMAARAARAHGSLAFRLPAGDAYTYVPGADSIVVVEGDAAADTVIELDAEAWQGLVHDYESAPGLLYAGRVRAPRGHAMRLVAWEPALRAIYTGRPVFDPCAVRLVDRAGEPLDPTRSFEPDADGAELAHFLRQTGYLFVRGLFAPEEVSAFLAEANELREEARKGDRLSWWARTAAGEEVLCRVTRGGDKPRLARLRHEERLARLAALSGERLVPRPGEGTGVTVIYKNPGVTEGLSDLPWHRDCGMGGHSVMCPVLVASLYLTPATPETGELRFLPGSWTHTVGFAEADDPRAPRGIAFAAEPGDVSLHYGDVMHAAPPPTRRDLATYRISAIVGFARPGVRPHRGERSYNEVLHQRPDGQIEHLRRVAERA